MPAGRYHIQVENRYNFTSLAELTIKWELDGHEGVVHSQLAPNSSGTVEIQPGFSRLPGLADGVAFRRPSGRTVETAAVGMEEAKEWPGRANHSASMRNRHWRGGCCEWLVASSRSVSTVPPDLCGVPRRAGFRCCIGAMLHIAPADPTVEEPVITEAEFRIPPLEVETPAERVVVTARGHYPKLKGTYRTVIESSGEMSVTYDFAYSGEDLIAREVGLQFGLPLTDDTLQSGTQR